MRKAEIVSAVLSNKFAVVAVSKAMLQRTEGYYIQDLEASTATKVNAKSAKAAIYEMMTSSGQVCKVYTKGTMNGVRKALVMYQTVDSL